MDSEKVTQKIFGILFFLTVYTYSLQGGPTQPDYTQFEPSGMKDMVNLLTGDFAYQIPLSNIPGPYGNYPLSLSYHAGISPQQEASWVGLGWSLNPGVINRDVRGVPDDQFHGGTLGFIYQYSAMQTWGVELGFSNGVFSVGQTFSSNGNVGYSASIGPRIAGVAGVGFTVGTEAVGLNASVGLNSYASLNSSLLFSTANGKAAASIGANLHAGGASMGAQISTGSGVSGNVGFGNSQTSFGLNVSSNGVSTSISEGQHRLSIGTGGVGIAVDGAALSIANSTSKGSNKASSTGFAVIIPTYIGVFSFGFNQTTYEYWMRAATSEYVYGYMYQAGPSIDVSDTNNLGGLPDAEIASRTAQGTSIPWKWTLKGRSLESIGKDDMCPAFDIYSVSTEGVSGTFRPFAREKHQLYKGISNEKTDGYESVESYSTIINDCEDGWPCENDFLKNGEGNLLSTGNGKNEDYAYCIRNNHKCSVYGMYQTNYRNNGNRLVFNSKDELSEERSGMRFMFIGEGGGYYESDDVGENATRPRNKASDRLIKRTLADYEYALYGSKRITPIFEDNSPVGKLAGFVITNADGTRYYFKQPVHSYLKVDYSINRDKGVPLFADKSSSKYENFWENLWSGIKAINDWSIEHALNPLAGVKDVYNFVFRSGTLEESCHADKESSTKDYFYSYSVNMNPYATQWLLTEIQGADYIKLGEKEIGYNVKFKYTEPTLYWWRTPYARPGLDAVRLPNFRSRRNAFTPEGCDSRMYQASFGVKEYVYLKSIETASHRVDFGLNTSERADGKGWEAGNSTVPIMVQASLGWEIDSVGEKGSKSFCVPSVGNSVSQCHHIITQNFSVTPKYIYFNSPIPNQIISNLYAGKTIAIHGIQYKTPSSYSDIVTYKKSNIDIVLDMPSMPKEFEIEPNSYARTQGAESIYGLYKLRIKSSRISGNLFYISENDTAILQEKENIVIGDNGDIVQNPYIDWSEIIFSHDSDNIFENQTRYLSKISYYKKDNPDAYKEYLFDYDYSLQPKTLNSYCKGKYPHGDSIQQVMESPDSVGMDICENSNRPSLYGKLTLRSVTEKGCQNKKCAFLPPFKFSYNSPAASPTRISTKDGWVDYFQGGIPKDDSTTKNLYPLDYFEGFNDLDATILASTNTTDEYGFWSNSANVENHKVSQEFADFGASAWSLNKITDPAGGVLTIEYERDKYGESIDYSQDKRTVEFFDFDKCSNYNITGDNENNLCIKIKPLYWREQCLGPRDAYWDKERPKGFGGSGFEYLDTMQVTIGSNLFFNLMTQVGTKVKCGMFGWGKCSRTRSVALVGDGILLNMFENSSDTSRILVLNRLFDNVETGIKKAAFKINKSQNWSIKSNDARNGYLWTGVNHESTKAGDLKVIKLTRHDIGLTAQTTYEYANGELAQLPDSSYTTVLGSRFYTTKVSHALPDVHLHPMSRIVGFDDDDLLFIPGPRITYPKVSVKNSSKNKTMQNGTTEFHYITPETGIPEDYIDDETKSLLNPFLKLNILGSSENPKADHDDGRIVRITVLDEAKNKIADTDAKTVILFPEKRQSLFFYSKQMSTTVNVKIETMNKDGSFNDSQTLIPLDSLTQFNEAAIAITTSDNVNENSRADLLWKRSQRLGFYPILYKRAEYASARIDLKAASNGAYDIDNIDVLLENGAAYHDFTSFLGLNYSITFKRGVSDLANVIVKKDSSIYSTAVPNMSEMPLQGIDYNTRYKIGRQVEKWSSEKKMHCVDKDGKKNLEGKKSVCKDSYMELYMRNPAEAVVHKEFQHIRYPAFQIGSSSWTGHDNQPSSHVSFWQKSSLENHLFDPLTGLPMATLAKTPTSDGKEMRKLTLKRPHYAVPVGDSSLANEMFRRNMFTQNFLTALYSGSVDTADKWNSIRTNDSLRSFEISPFRFLPDSIYSIQRKPIVAWGNFKSRKEPKDILNGDELEKSVGAFQSTDPDAGENFPDKDNYVGNRFLLVDNHYRVRESADDFDRITSTHYSYDGMHETGIFFPARLSEVGSIVPYGDTIAMANCSLSSQGYDITDNIILRPQGYMKIECAAESDNRSLVAEYAIKKSGRPWERIRERISEKTFSLTLYGGYLLSYLRVYPEDAVAKTFIYDRYGNLVRIISENNISTYYEYDPFGYLVQSRDDDGNSFKIHHREYRNDDRTSVQQTSGGN